MDLLCLCISGAMAWKILSWHTLGLSVPTDASIRIMCPMSHNSSHLKNFLKMTMSLMYTDFNPAEHLWDDLLHRCTADKFAAAVSRWIKISKEC